MEIINRIKDALSPESQPGRNVIFLNEFKTRQTQQRIDKLGLSSKEMDAVTILTDQNVALSRAREGAATREALRRTNHSPREIEEIQRITDEITNLRENNLPQPIGNKPGA